MENAKSESEYEQMELFEMEDAKWGNGKCQNGRRENSLTVNDLREFWMELPDWLDVYCHCSHCDRLSPTIRISISTRMIPYNNYVVLN